ncbi:hypothetical protein VTH06DRAFT_7087 [Thermothelomyces fergusii]
MIQTYGRFPFPALLKISKQPTHAQLRRGPFVHIIPANQPPFSRFLGSEYFVQLAKPPPTHSITSQPESSDPSLH